MNIPIRAPSADSAVAERILLSGGDSVYGCCLDSRTVTGDA